jgi:hypothetical protein
MVKKTFQEINQGFFTFLAYKGPFAQACDLKSVSCQYCFFFFANNLAVLSPLASSIFTPGIDKLPSPSILPPALSLAARQDLLSCSV